ncbi:unannotated protein [freshwater metagenome]|uniref:Unannotated protein n=1 Tax=freshwater metagenome TaxID=449393 RepID=A0A6J7LAI7_9ZZZZ
MVDDPSSATATTDFLIVPSLSEYGPARIAKSRRGEVHEGVRENDFAILHEPGLLLAQGWGALSAAAKKTGQLAPRDEEAYRAEWTTVYSGSPPLVIAATQRGRLLGYVVSYGVSGHAAIEEVVIAPWARQHAVGAALYWIHLRMWASTPGIGYASLGRRFPERESLDYFKTSMGAEVTSLPVVGAMRAPARAFLRVRRPHAHSRLVGAPVVASLPAAVQ